MLKTNAGLYGCKILKQVQDDNIKYKKKYAATHSAEQKTDLMSVFCEREPRTSKFARILILKNMPLCLTTL